MPEPTSPKTFGLIQSTITILLLLFYFFYAVVQPALDYLIVPTFVFIILNFGWALYSWTRLSGRIFSPYSLFLVAATLFNGGWAFLILVGINYFDYATISFSMPALANNIPRSASAAIQYESFLLVAMSLASLHLGAIINYWQPRVKLSHAPQTAEPSERYLLIMRLVGLFFLMISIGPTVEVVQHFLGISVGQNYTEIYKYATPLGWNAAPAILSRFINPGILMLLVGCKNHKKLAIIVAVFMVLYASLWLFIGSRAPAAMLLVAFIWCWDSYVKPLPKSLLLIGGSVLVFVFFPILSIIRFNSAVYRLQDIFVVLTSGVANLFISMVSEMGNTVNIIGHTLYLVPTYRPFDLGQSYFYSLATILPNFGSGIHPTAERQLANWLVWTINPSHASYGFGYGFSFIAEAYLNFGWLGSQLVMLFFGFVLARFSIWSQLSKDPARCAFVATLLSFLLLFARGEFSQYPRYITWYMLIPLGVVWLVLTFTKTNKFEQIKGVH